MKSDQAEIWREQLSFTGKDNPDIIATNDLPCRTEKEPVLLYKSAQGQKNLIWISCEAIDQKEPEFSNTPLLADSPDRGTASHILFLCCDPH